MNIFRYFLLQCPDNDTAWILFNWQVNNWLVAALTSNPSLSSNPSFKYRKVITTNPSTLIIRTGFQFKVKLQELELSKDDLKNYRIFRRIVLKLSKIIILTDPPWTEDLRIISEH